MTNKFTARGISKETGKFVYGYYFYEMYGKGKHYIISVEYAPDFEYGHCEFFTEITQEPDRCLDFKDKNGRVAYERDVLKLSSDTIKSDYHIINSLEDWVYFYIGLPFRIKEEDKEIIGNTHNIKENNDK